MIFRVALLIGIALPAAAFAARSDWSPADESQMRLLLTSAGSLIGLLIGVGFSKIITSSIGVPLHIDAKSFVSAYLLAAIFGFVFALYPAWKAARLSPMEALHYE